jgi:endonuclease YncB( thermonuclease family)
VKKIISLFLFFSYSILAKEIIHDFKIIEVIDGDTIKIEANYLPNPLPKNLKLRIIGIDTPEKGNRAKCDLERVKAKEATEFLKKFIASESILGISLTKWDKFGGRVLGDIITQDNQRVSQIMIDRGYGRPYHGKKKTSWCD